MKNKRKLKSKGKIIKIYELGKKAQMGNEKAMLEILRVKNSTIKYYCFGNEDCYQTIILKIIKGIKNYRTEKEVL